MDVGENAPSFCLNDMNGNEVCLDDLKGKWVVLYFYPKDDTPGCTIEAKGFTKMKSTFEKEGAMIFGISPDTGSSHCDFVKKYDLSITLLSDTAHGVIDNYGAWTLKKMYGKEYHGVERSTFLINPEGKIAHIWRKVDVEGHIDEVLKKFREMRADINNEYS